MGRVGRLERLRAFEHDLGPPNLLRLEEAWRKRRLESNLDRNELDSDCRVVGKKLPTRVLETI